MRTPDQHSNSRAVNGAANAFSLLELLVVLAIIGILASIALPSIKGMRMSGGLAAASRQMLDDTALARRFAIQNRTTVLMVFLPPVDPGTAGTFAQLSDSERNILVRGQQTTYALFSVREVGDQPGRSQPRYLKSWTALPEGFMIPAWKFDNRRSVGIAVTNLLTGDVATLIAQPFFQKELRVPTVASATSIEVFMPYIAFGPEGNLQRFNNGLFENLTEDEIIPLARGSVLLERNVVGGKTVFPWQAADVAERPAGNSTNNYNLVVIDHVTGKGRIVRPEIP